MVLHVHSTTAFARSARTGHAKIMKTGLTAVKMVMGVKDVLLVFVLKSMMAHRVPQKHPSAVNASRVFARVLIKQFVVKVVGCVRVSSVD